MPKLKCISSESPDEISRFLEVHVWLYSFVQSINHRTDLRKKICTLAISRFFFLALKKNAIKSHGQLWSWTPVQFTLEPHKINILVSAFASLITIFKFQEKNPGMIHENIQGSIMGISISPLFSNQTSNHLSFKYHTRFHFKYQTYPSIQYLLGYDVSNHL